MARRAITAVTRDGRQALARDGRSERAAVNIDRIRKDMQERHGGRNLRMPYAGGGPRRAPRTAIMGA
jgi:hypothetical protein